MPVHKKIILFLGAGASAQYELPTTEKFLEILRESYQDHPILQSLLKCEKFTDVEYVLQAVKDMLKFHQTEGGKYYQWQGEQRHMSVKINRESHPYEQLVEQLPDVRQGLQKEIFDGYKLNATRHGMQIDATLTPILEFLKTHSDKIMIFTTNYDRVIEEFARRQSEQFSLIDGFRSEHNQEYVFDSNVSEHNDLGSKHPIFLYKLHGSLNWVKGNDGRIQRISVETKLDLPNENLLIYPTLSPKEDADTEPYLTLFKKFETNMEKADMLIVIGSSFRDREITNKISEQFVDRKKKLIILSPTGIRDYCQNILKKKYTKDPPQVLRPNHHTLILNRELNYQTSQEIVDEFEGFLDEA